MGIKSSIFGLLSRLRGSKPKAAPPVHTSVKPATKPPVKRTNGHYDPKLRTDSFYEPHNVPEEDLLPDKPARAGTPPPAPKVDLPARAAAGTGGLSRFHYLRGPEYPVSSWVVSYGLAEHRDTGEIGLIVELLSGEVQGVEGHAGGTGLGAGKRISSYKPIKGNKIMAFWYPGLGEAKFRDIDDAGSKGEWMDKNIVKEHQKYQNLSTGEWGPKPRKK